MGETAGSVAALGTADVAVPADGVLRAATGGGARVAALPTATAQCHAANLHRLPDGDLACVWFGGTQEGVSDICVYLSRLPAGSDRWLEPVRLSEDAQRSEQNPVLFTPTGRGREVWVLWTAQLAGSQDTAEVRRRVSADGGDTWGKPHVLFAAEPGRGVFVRQPPLALPDGRLLVGTFSCITPERGRWVGDLDTSSVWISDDGDTWREVPVPESTGSVHLGLVPRSDGSLWGYARSRFAERVHATTSEDGGLTWAPARPTVLPNNNSSVQAVTLGDGVMAMVYNHASVADATGRRTSLYDEIADDGTLAAGGSPDAAGDDPAPDGVGAESADAGRTAFWGAPRAPMALAVSVDDARTWPVRLDLESGDGYCLSNNSREGVNRELSYPSVLPDGDGGLHVAYTWHRKVIKHVHLAPGVVAGLTRLARAAAETDVARPVDASTVLAGAGAGG